MNTTRWGSVLMPDVKPSWLGRLLGGSDFERAQAVMGGVWVGGKISIDDEGIAYRPVWWDRYLHLNLRPISVPIGTVQRISFTDQGATGTVFVQHTQGEFIFRCYRAERVATALSMAVEGRSRSPSLAA